MPSGLTHRVTTTRLEEAARDERDRDRPDCEREDGESWGAFDNMSVLVSQGYSITPPNK
jgi:hypothetical protein